MTLKDQTPDARKSLDSDITRLAEFISPLSEASSGVTPGVVSVYASTDIEVTPLAIKPSISVVVRPQSAHLSLKAAWDFKMPAIAIRGSRKENKLTRRP